MPPKKTIATGKISKPVKKRIAAKGFKLPDPIASGQILTDVTRNKWRLGTSIGQGGFGEIYSASNILDKPVGENASFVIKIEPHSNGPLFTEMHCYMRIAKPDSIETWKRERKLKRLGMPKYLGSGSLDYKGQKYRFMVMERFGSDLQKIIDKLNKKFSYKTVMQVALQVLDALEYIHSNEYIHADVKASNLLVGYQAGTENQVFLVDYGLACRYKIDGKHKEYKYDQRKAHDGTIEFTSRDAHIGAHSRRGDLEILGYNIVQWLCGKLPWEDNLADCDYVASKKRACMDDVPKFLKTCFPDGVPPGVQQYVEYVSNLTFDENPSYDRCRSILRDGLKVRGYKDDGKLVFVTATPKAACKIPVSKLAGRKKALKRRSDEENICDSSPVKRVKSFERSPCKPRNQNSRANTRLGPKDSKDKKTDILDCDYEEMLIEKENEKMLVRHQNQRPKRLQIKRDTTLDNPTPQMLEIMAKIREKSISPPICTKKHHHNGNCQLSSRISPVFEEPPTSLTPEMEALIKKKSGRRDSTDSSYSTRDASPDMFDSEGEEEDFSANNATVYYSPCGGTSPEGICSSHKHRLSSGAISTRSSRRNSINAEKTLPNRRTGRPARSAAVRGMVETRKMVDAMRVTRGSMSRNTSPEVI